MKLESNWIVFNPIILNLLNNEIIYSDFNIGLYKDKLYIKTLCIEKSLYNG